MSRALARDLAELGADINRYLGLHQIAGDQPDRLANEIAVLARHHLATTSAVVILCSSAIVVLLLDRLFGRNRRVWTPRWPEPSRPDEQAPWGT